MSHQYEALLRLFVAQRLHPWIPEHDLFIKGEIAKLEVTDPSNAESQKKFYAEKMQKYIDEHPEEFPPVEEVIETPVIPVEPDVTPVETPIEAVEPPVEAPVKKVKKPKVI